MARKVFFSFHYARDAWRVAQVRNCWLVRAGHETQPFLDGAAWESIKRQGDTAIKRWIDRQLAGTSVTVVLIGAATALRPYVQYEIAQSVNERKGLLGIRIHNLKDQNGAHDAMGANPFQFFQVARGLGYSVALSSIIPVYDWVQQDGRRNMGEWIERAATTVGR